MRSREEPRRVLLTFNERNQAATEFTRVLRREGFEVHHFMVTGHQPVLTDPAFQAQALLEIQQKVTELGIDILIPTFEEAFFLSDHASTFPCRGLWNPAHLLRELHSKRRGALFNRRHGLPHVPAMLPDSTTRLEDIEEFAATHRGPRTNLFLKEDDSRGGYGTEAFDSPAALWKGLAGRDPSTYVIQPYQPGDIWVVQGVFLEGRLVDHEIMRSVSLWKDDGMARYVPFLRSLEDPTALDLLERVGRITGFQGMMEFECLGEEGDIRILEYNPRFSGAILQSVLTGSSLCENTVRAYAGLEAIPHRSGAGMARNEVVWKRSLRRTFSTSPRSLLDPRWIGRWLMAEVSHAQCRARSPYLAYSNQPVTLSECSANPVRPV